MEGLNFHEEECTPPLYNEVIGTENFSFYIVILISWKSILHHKFYIARVYFSYMNVYCYTVILAVAVNYLQYNSEVVLKHYFVESWIYIDNKTRRNKTYAKRIIKRCPENYPQIIAPRAISPWVIAPGQFPQR